MRYTLETDQNYVDAEERWTHQDCESLVDAVKVNAKEYNLELSSYPTVVIRQQVGNTGEVFFYDPQKNNRAVLHNIVFDKGEIIEYTHWELF
jgi:hypothetical protein